MKYERDRLSSVDKNLRRDEQCEDLERSLAMHGKEAFWGRPVVEKARMNNVKLETVYEISEKPV